MGFEMLDLTFLNLTPPIVTLSDAPTSDVIELINSDNIKPAEKNVLRALLEVSKAKERAYCSGSELSSFIGSSAETVRKALISMSEKQIFEKMECKTKQGTRRKAFLYRLNKSAIPSCKSTNIKSISSIEELKSLVNPSDEMFGKVEVLIFKLAVCLEHSHKSDTTSKKAIIYIDNEPVNILVESAGNNVIAKVRDMRYYVAILRLCLDAMKRRYAQYLRGSLDLAAVLKSEFVIAETDILRSMNLDMGSTSRKHAHNAMMRLDSTTYKILSAPKAFMDEFKIKEYFAKVSHFDVRNYAKTIDDRVAYQIELSSSQIQSLFEECKSQDSSLLLQVDHRIYNERNPLAFIFTFFSSSMKLGAINRYTFQSLKDNIAPNMQLRDFKIQLSNLLYKHRLEQYDGDGNKIDYIEWTSGKKVIKIINAKFNGIEVSIPDGETIFVQRDTNYERVTVNKRISSRGIKHRITPQSQPPNVPKNLK
tara:strand:+ start:156 stop:1589 length:1434 start_codon:yes stop_codon:yes gene_type:complete